MALGAHLAASQLGLGLKHAWATDYDRDTCETYRRNIPGASEDSVLCRDVRELDFDSLSPIDGFAFGFPCNDFSQVGEKRGTEGKFGPLYKFGVGIVNHFSPSWFVAENVGGLKSSNDGKAFRRILEELSRAGDYGGYKLVPHLYRFEEYGVPQARHRILITGIRSDLPATFQVPSTRPFRGIDVSASRAINTPRIESGAANHELTKQHPRVVERLEHIRPGQNAFNADLPEHLKLNVSGATISQIYRRLDPSRPSYTVTGSGGGGTHVYHWSEPRALTNRERARLQTFPDDFVFQGSKESVRKQIGMAVPVRGAQVVFDALFRSLEGLDYESTASNLETYIPRDSGG